MKKGILLLSGGIDSAVAASFALDSKQELISLHFVTEKITGKESLEKAKKLCKILKLKKLYSVEASNAFAEISKKCDHKYYFVLMKRLMLKTAQKLAQKHKCTFILTGESLGQVSSQTLSNLSTIDQASTIPVLRPLLGFDKQEIMDYAQKIGTFEASTGKEMCDALGPPHPATKSSVETILEEEKKLVGNPLLELEFKEEKL